ncbi:MAG: hypothetical protein BWY49_00911 [Candidatus Omnitrophica bacterium ADurb.Bin314]|nr:MAG: hypothetical protein BWY49_00911 [Candidatus Omnitrophica bacterium ADurb.Bin314]
MSRNLPECRENARSFNAGLFGIIKRKIPAEGPARKKKDGSVSFEDQKALDGNDAFYVPHPVRNDGIGLPLLLEG